MTRAKKVSACRWAQLVAAIVAVAALVATIFGWLPVTAAISIAAVMLLLVLVLGLLAKNYEGQKETTTTPPAAGDGAAPAAEATTPRKTRRQLRELIEENQEKFADKVDELDQIDDELEEAQFQYDANERRIEAAMQRRRPRPRD